MVAARRWNRVVWIKCRVFRANPGTTAKTCQHIGSLVEDMYKANPGRANERTDQTKFNKQSKHSTVNMDILEKKEEAITRSE